MVSEDEDRSKPFITLSSARACDSCKTSSAHLFCRADSAFLCAGCDAKVHGANKLASRHERVWMCEVCEQAPASFTCKADAAALCVTCDRDIHSANPLARRHERLPVVPFYHSPAAAAAFVKSTVLSLLDDGDGDGDGDDAVPVPNDACQDDADGDDDPASWLFYTPNTKLTDGQDLKSGGDYFFSDVDPYLDLDYVSAMDGRFHQHNAAGADSVVPVQSKPFNSPVLNPSPDNGSDQDFCRPKASYGSYTAAPSLSQSVSSSSLDVGIVPDGSDISTPFGASLKNGAEAAVAATGGNWNPAAAAAAQQLSGLDREARVMRYREKRKNRKFEKTIRYASRKAYAETRPRIKGRFAKRTEIETEVDRIYSAAAGAALITDTGYGVVPTF